MPGISAARRVAGGVGCLSWRVSYRPCWAFCMHWMERDLKRILAYSTVEHIVGIIVIGLGTAVLLDSRGHDEIAALALVATLVHLFNHSLFKSLFFAAGAIQTATGTRDLSGSVD
ncbi:MAG: proton-conducting transporter membrane subunit [Thermomicrobiales bacterium]